MRAHEVAWSWRCANSCGGTISGRHTLRVHSPTELLTVSMAMTFGDQLEIWMSFVGLSMVSIYVLT